MMKGTWINGEPDGSYESFYDTGQLRTQGTYKDGKREGPWETYNNNGQLNIKGIYKDGEQCGEWFEFGLSFTYPPCLRIVKD